MNNKLVEIRNAKSLTPSLLNQLGFTLIELSIVLVIIGLIVGGVLVGQDLIKAAEIRATVSQYEKYNTSMNTFRTKYNGMPGDLAMAQVNAFGLNPAAGALTAGGDGNGLIESSVASNLNLPKIEPVLIWQQLAASNLSGDNAGVDLTTGALPAGTAPATYLPAARLGRGNFWLAGSSAGVNYYGLSNPTVFAASGAAYGIAAGGGLTPIEAFNIDSKIDDGLPNAGIVQARGTTASASGTPADNLFPTLSETNAGRFTATTPVATDCQAGTGTLTDTTNTYSRGTLAGNAPNCQLRLRFN